MTKLEQLISEFCPDGVEYRKIEEVCIKISSGGTPNTSHNKYYNGTIPWLRTQEVDWLDIMDTEVKISDEGLKNSSAKMISENCVIVAMYGATAAKVAINKIPLCTNQACCNLQTDNEIVLYKYMYYWLCNNYETLKSHGQGSQSNINAKIIKDFKIPIPPLPVQEEIVRILDKFTELTTKLTAELTTELIARKKQYEYYRDSLFDFGDGVERRSIGSLCLVTKLAGYEFTEHVIYSDTGNIIALRGLNIKNGSLDLEQVKYIDNSNLSKLNRSKLIIGDMLFTYVGTIGQVALIDVNNKYYLGPNVALVRTTSEKILPKYMQYYFQTNLFTTQQVNKLLQNSSMKNLTMEKIRLFKIPIPPLEEQQRIVNILDRFDTICNDISSGLPAEIKARKKQYEYYRDKLLDFKEKV